MGRIARDGVDYFAVDVEFDDNVLIVIAKHKNAGLGILLRLWQKCYRQKGYYMDWGEDNALLFADEINVDIDTLNALVDTCFRVDVFHRGLWEKYQILTSSGIQKRWRDIVTSAKRMNTEIDPKFDISGLNADKLGVNKIDSGYTPGKSAKTPEEMTQSKVKKSKRKESKVKQRTKKLGATSAPKEEKIPADVWKLVVETWFVFYEQQKGEKPSFAGRDPAHLKALIRLVEQKVLAAPGHKWDGETCAPHFLRFLTIAYTDTWLKQNFLLQNLLNQFDKIIANGRSTTNTQSAATGIAVTGSQPAGTSTARVAALTNWGSHLSSGNTSTASG